MVQGWQLYVPQPGTFQCSGANFGLLTNRAAAHGQDSLETEYDRTPSPLRQFLFFLSHPAG